MEYLEEACESLQSIRFNNLKEWRDSFQGFCGGVSEEHLVDRVFQSLYLEDINRNEMPVMTFVEIISSLYKRIDETLERIVLGDEDVK